MFKLRVCEFLLASNIAKAKSPAESFRISILPPEFITKSEYVLFFKNTVSKNNNNFRIGDILCKL